MVCGFMRVTISRFTRWQLFVTGQPMQGCVSLTEQREDEQAGKVTHVKRIVIGATAQLNPSN